MLNNMENQHKEELNTLNLDFNKRGGLLPVIVQETISKDILMLGYTNYEAYKITKATSLVTFWSTSREKIWTKGESSGDYLKLLSIRVDCDQDALLYIVEKKGLGTCHTKNKEGDPRHSCFFREYDLAKGKLILLEP